MKNEERPVDPPRFVGHKQMEDILHVSHPTLAAYRERGLPCYRPNPKGKIMFDPDEAIAWVKKHCRATTAA